MPLYHRTFGADAGRTVLFLHGFLGSSADWLPIISRLPDIHCVCLDLPGHGRSTALSSSYYSFSGVIEALDATLDELQIEAADFVGYSMGGRLGLTYAMSRPARCRSLLLESASPGIDVAIERSERLRLDAEHAAALRATSMETFLREWYRQPLFASLAERKDVLERLIRERRDASNQDLARAIEAFSPGRQQSWWDQLATLRTPVTFIAGDRDVKYVEIGGRFSELAPRAALAVVEDAGHNVHLERPEAYLRLVLNHLEATS